MYTWNCERVKLTLHTLYKAQVLFGSSLWEWAASEWMVPSTEFPGCFEHPKKDILKEEVTALFDRGFILDFASMNCIPRNCIWVMVKGRLVVEMTAWWKTLHPWLLGCPANSQILLCLQIGPKNTYGTYKTLFFSLRSSQHSGYILTSGVLS